MSGFGQGPNPAHATQLDELRTLVGDAGWELESSEFDSEFYEVFLVKRGVEEVEVHLDGDSRSVTIYDFTLTEDDPGIDNPVYAQERLGEDYALGWPRWVANMVNSPEFGPLAVVRRLEAREAIELTDFAQERVAGQQIVDARVTEHMLHVDWLRGALSGTAWSIGNGGGIGEAEEQFVLVRDEGREAIALVLDAEAQSWALYDMTAEWDAPPIAERQVDAEWDGPWDTAVVLTAVEEIRQLPDPQPPNRHAMPPEVTGIGLSTPVPYWPVPSPLAGPRL